MNDEQQELITLLRARCRDMELMQNMLMTQMIGAEKLMRNLISDPGVSDNYRCKMITWLSHNTAMKGRK